MKLRVTEQARMAAVGGGALSLPGSRSSPLQRGGRAFTLIEIAVCLGIIAFALVAIIGILPAGLQVQRDNREETVINQEGTYLLEAIRNGAEGLDDLSNRVTLIVISNVAQRVEVLRVDNRPTQPNRLTAKQIVGLLSTPSDLLTNEVLEVRAIMYSGAGSAATIGTELDFQYQVAIRNFPYTNYGPGAQALLSRYFRDVRVDVRWPVLQAEKVGIGRHNFRGQFSGVMDLEPHPNFPTGLWFVRQ